MLQPGATVGYLAQEPELDPKLDVRGNVELGLKHVKALLERYEEINAWERALVDDGVRILKFALMVSYEEQGARLMERLDRPDKHWKYSPGDLKTRAKWDAYQEAYADVFRLTSTEYAPWYVLPADRKWYPRLAVTEILTRTLEEMNLDWPKATFDVEEQRAALAATMRR